MEDGIEKTQMSSVIFGLPSESLTGRWCCYRPAGRTQSALAHHADPTIRLLSLPHVPPLSQSPWSQRLLLQDRATPTRWGEKWGLTGVDILVYYCAHKISGSKKKDAVPVWWLSRAEHKSDQPPPLQNHYDPPPALMFKTFQHKQPANYRQSWLLLFVNLERTVWLNSGNAVCRIVENTVSMKKYNTKGNNTEVKYFE